MSNRGATICAAAAALLAVQTAPTFAQSSGSQSHGSDIGIAVRAGTLGVGGEISKLLNSHIGLRVGANYFTLTDNGQKLGDSKFNLKAEMRAFSALLDLYLKPRGSFHLTAGMVTKPVKISGTGVGSSYSFNGHDYTSSQAGTLTVGAVYPSTMPYAGIGIGTAASSHGGLSFVFDLGVAIGKPTFSLTGSNVTNGSTLDTDLKAEVAKRQTDADKLPGYPVLAIGFMYRF